MLRTWFIAMICGADSITQWSTSRPRASFPITGFWMDGAFTKRSVQFD